MKIKKSVIFVLSALFLLNFLVATSFAAENTNNVSEKNVKQSQQFQIVLKSNPSTGYSWNVSYNPKYLKLVSQEYVSSNIVGMVGAPGKQIFTFKALKIGETSVTFNYLRTWENQIVKTEQYKVKIAKNQQRR